MGASGFPLPGSSLWNQAPLRAACGPCRPPEAPGPAGRPGLTWAAFAEKVAVSFWFGSGCLRPGQLPVASDIFVIPAPLEGLLWGISTSLFLSLCDLRGLSLLDTRCFWVMGSWASTGSARLFLSFVLWLMLTISSDTETLRTRALNICLPAEAAEQAGETPTSGARRELIQTPPPHNLFLVSLGALLPTSCLLISNCFLPQGLCTASISLCFLLA